MGFCFMVLVLLVLGLAVGRKVWPKVGNFVLPLHCSSLEERADMAHDFCERHGLRSDCCVFVDFGMPSKEKRFMVYDLRKKRIISRGLVAHGMGTPSTEERPAFSNRPGSNCSSVGRYKIGPLWRGQKIGRCYSLDGYDYFLNNNARSRGIFIHTSRTVNKYEKMKKRPNIPLGKVSEGCFTISSSSFAKLGNILESDSKPMLLWAYCGDKY